MSGSDRVVSLYQRSQRAKESAAVRDIALLAARIGLAWIFIYHGSYTLFGAFGGPGIHRASVFYGTVAHLHPATFFTVLGGVIELFGGAAVGLGVFGRLAAAGIAGDMAMAMATVTWANGISSSKTGGGYELNLALCVLALAVALLGTGRYAADQLVARMWARRRATPGGHLAGRRGGNDRHDQPGPVAAA